MTAPVGRPWLAEVLDREEVVKSYWFSTRQQAERWARYEASQRPQHRAKVTRVIHDEQMSLLGESPPILDREAGNTLRDAGIASVDDNAFEEWKSAADNAYRIAAHRHREFTNDVIWQILEDEWGVPPPHDRRALGARARAAVKAGLIENTGRYVGSERPNVHRSLMPVYLSLVYPA